MRSLEEVIRDMRSTRDVSQDNAIVATHPIIREIAQLYSSLFTGYIERLEEVNRIINMQTSISQAEQEITALNHLFSQES